MGVKGRLVSIAGDVVGVPEGHWLVSYRDSGGLPRAWAKGSDKDAVCVEAARQLEAYKVKLTERGEPWDDYTRVIERCSTERVRPVRAALRGED